jgi:hypothetical protein
MEGGLKDTQPLALEDFSNTVCVQGQIDNGGLVRQNWNPPEC